MHKKSHHPSSFDKKVLPMMKNEKRGAECRAKKAEKRTEKLRKMSAASKRNIFCTRKTLYLINNGI